MEVDLEEIDIKTLKSFVASISNFSWTSNADENLIDTILNQSIAIQEYFNFENSNLEKLKKYSNLNFSKAVEMTMENIIKSPHVNEKLTLYAIKKYLTLYPNHDFCKILENILTEMKLRESLANIIDTLSEKQIADVDWNKINDFIDEFNECNNSDECNYKILNSLKLRTSILLNALGYSSVTSGQALTDKVIECLEAQEDLRLWFSIMKEENLGLVLELCLKFNNFFDAVLKFFDKFADEVETNCDEDLNIKYSHLNLDFEDFIEIFKKFLNNENLNKAISDYLNSKILGDDKNFIFWVDVNSCIGEPIVQNLIN